MIDRFRIATRDLAERDRLPLMRDFYGRIALGVEIDPSPDSPFEMEISTALLPSVGLGSGVISPIHANRSRQFAQDGNAGLLLSAFTTPFHVSNRNLDRLPVRPGQVLATPMDLPSLWTYEAAGEVRSVWVDRRALARYLPGFELDGPVVLDLHSPMIRLLYAYASIVRDTPAANADEIALMDRQLLEIAAMALGGLAHPDEIGARSGVRAARLAAVKEDIAGIFQRQGLSVGEVARRHGVTVRYVQMLFEADGTTFTDHLQAMRLGHAFDLLRNPRAGHLRIADIAFEAGFTDLSTFNRLFRRRFGDTPSGVRAGSSPG